MTIGASYGDAYFEPDPSAKPVYDELYDLYRGLYVANREDMHRIADLQERGSAGSR